MLLLADCVEQLRHELFSKANLDVFFYIGLAAYGLDFFLKYTKVIFIITVVFPILKCLTAIYRAGTNAKKFPTIKVCFGGGAVHYV